MRLIHQFLLKAFEIISLLGMTTACTDSILAPPELSAEGEQAYEIIENTEIFAGSSVGFAGTTSEQVKAFRILLQEPDPDGVFKSLLDRATMAGQLYALSGLYFTDPQYLDGVSDRYLEMDDEVKTMFGCILGKNRVSGLIEQIIDGTFPGSFKERR
jgi:hypothetical protein